MKKQFILSLSLGVAILFPTQAFAGSGDLELLPSTIHFSTKILTEGRSTRLYATIKNNSTNDLYGTVKIVDSTKSAQIGNDQPLSVIAQKTDDIFVDWNPAAGEHTINVSIIPWQKGDNTNNNSYSFTVFVIADQDYDGIADNVDADIDGDGVINTEDAFPRDSKEWKDTDGDGIGDNSDPDIDGDNFLNTDDAFPLDPKEWKDTNHNGIGDNSDPDIDGEGLNNTEEAKLGTNPLLVDTDGDGIDDKHDAFPLNPKEWKDTNHNGAGDNSDPDVDGDGILNAQDTFPANIAPVADAQRPPMIVAINKPFTLDAGLSNDPDGKITEVIWTVNDQKKYYGISPSIIVNEAGNHKIQLEVKDNNGETKTKEWMVYGTASVLLAQGGVTGILIALALLAVLYYSTKALRKGKKKEKQA